MIAGWDDGNHLAKLKAYAASLGLEGHVHFSGPLFGADKEAALMHASAFVLASYSEGLPMAALEAWSHRTPVFMTAACNLSEGFNVGAAIEVATEPGAMAEILLTHLDDPGLPQLGLAGRKLVEDRFTWDQVGDDFLAVHCWLLEGGLHRHASRCRDWYRRV